MFLKALVSAAGDCGQFRCDSGITPDLRDKAGVGSPVSRCDISGESCDELAGCLLDELPINSSVASGHCGQYEFRLAGEVVVDRTRGQSGRGYHVGHCRAGKATPHRGTYGLQRLNGQGLWAAFRCLANVRKVHFPHPAGRGAALRRQAR